MYLNLSKDFLLGTATSANQIEVSGDSDFRSLVSRDGSRFGDGIDHLAHLEEDIKYISMLGNSYRLSLDWSKLQQSPNSELDKNVVQKYLQLFRGLKKNKLKLVLTLHHFANPQWFTDMGGWENRNSSDLFLNYVQKVYDIFGKFVDYWITINEPGVYSSESYINGYFPPHKKSILSAYNVLNNLQRAHIQSYDFLKSKDKNFVVGVSKNLPFFYSTDFFGKISAFVSDLVFNNYIASKFFRKTDFLGINYYGKTIFSGFKLKKVAIWDKSPSEIDYPEGLFLLSKKMFNKYNKPIMITENGVCTDDDSVRTELLNSFLERLGSEISSGLNIIGYFYWSTFDNHEWALGRDFRLGLVEIDYKNKMSRKLKGSGKFYSKIVSRLKS